MSEFDVPMFVLPTSVSDPSLPRLDQAPVPVVPAGVEEAAAGHWMFGKNALSLVALNNANLALTASAPVAGPPTFGDTTVTISSAGRHGLIMPWLDTAFATTGITVAVALQHIKVAESRYIWGSRTQTAADNGLMGWCAAAGNDTEGNPIAGNQTRIVSAGSAAQLAVAAPGFQTGVDVGKSYIMMFMASAEKGLAMYSAGAKRRGAAANYVANGAAAPFVAGGRALTLGNVHYAQSSWQAGLIYHELVVMPWHLAEEECDALAARMVSRNLDRPEKLRLLA